MTLYLFVTRINISGLIVKRNWALQTLGHFRKHFKEIGLGCERFLLFTLMTLNKLIIPVIRELYVFIWHIENIVKLYKLKHQMDKYKKNPYFFHKAHSIKAENYFFPDVEIGRILFSVMHLWAKCCHCEYWINLNNKLLKLYLRPNQCLWDINKVYFSPFYIFFTILKRTLTWEGQN